VYYILKSRTGCWTAKVVIDIAIISEKFSWNFDVLNCGHPTLVVLSSDWSSSHVFFRLSLEIGFGVWRQFWNSLCMKTIGFTKQASICIRFIYMVIQGSFICSKILQKFSYFELILSTYCMGPQCAM
jgi:hypothetical protein